jgi:hypothetical protein
MNRMLVALSAVCLPMLSVAAPPAPAVTIVNTADNPVPVTLPIRTLQASAITISGSSSITVPAGVVLTDLVMTTGDADCTSVSIGLIDNPIGAGNLDLPGPNAQLHLTTGVLSKAESPLIIRIPVNCAASIFWSGYTE